MTSLFEPDPAVFSPCRTWRYVLRRRWTLDGEPLLVVMLNPSKADETRSDNTVTRCINFAKALGFPGLTVANIFAYMATDPKDMRRAPDPIGPDNDEWLRTLAEQHETRVVAWGSNGTYRGRAHDVLRRGLLGPRGELLCWAHNPRSGEPQHPLMLPNAATLRPLDKPNNLT